MLDEKCDDNAASHDKVFDFVPKEVLEKLINFHSTRVMLVGLAKLSGIIVNSKLINVPFECLFQIISVLTKLLESTDLGVMHSSLKVLNLLIERLHVHPDVEKVLEFIIPAVFLTLGDSMELIMVEQMEIFKKAMSIYGPKWVVDYVLEHLPYSNPAINKDALNIIITALLNFPIKDFDLFSICKKALPFLASSDLGVRHATMELLALLDACLRSNGNTFMDMEVLQMERNLGAQGLLTAVQVRRSKCLIPSLTSKGLVKYGVMLPNLNCDRITADMDWVLFGNRRWTDNIDEQRVLNNSPSSSPTNCESATCKNTSQNPITDENPHQSKPTVRFKLTALSALDLPSLPIESHQQATPCPTRQKVIPKSYISPNCPIHAKSGSTPNVCPSDDPQPQELPSITPTNSIKPSVICPTDDLQPHPSSNILSQKETTIHLQSEHSIHSQNHPQPCTHTQNTEIPSTEVLPTIPNSRLKPMFPMEPPKSHRRPCSRGQSVVKITRSPPEKEMDPVELLMQILSLLRSDKWYKAVKGLELLRSFVEKNTEVAQKRSNEVCCAVIDTVKCIQSPVARAGLVTMGFLYTHLKKSMNHELERTINALLPKAGFEYSFMRQEVDMVLACMVQNCDPIITFHSLVKGGMRNRSPAVRNCTAKHLANALERIGIDRVMAASNEVKDMIFHAVARLAHDASEGARHSGRRMLKFLASHKKFDQVALRHLPQSDYEEVVKTLKNLKKNEAV